MSIFAGHWCFGWCCGGSRKNEASFSSITLMHDYAYSAASKGENPPELEARMENFREPLPRPWLRMWTRFWWWDIHRARIWGCRCLRILIRAGAVPQRWSCAGILTLGQVVPMVSFLPKAQRLRADLRFLSARKSSLGWMSQRPVMAVRLHCVILCRVSGVAPEDKKWPLVFSAPFTQSAEPRTLERTAVEVFQAAFSIPVRF